MNSLAFLIKPASSLCSMRCDKSIMACMRIRALPCFDCLWGWQTAPIILTGFYAPPQILQNRSHNEWFSLYNKDVPLSRHVFCLFIRCYTT